MSTNEEGQHRGNDAGSQTDQNDSPVSIITPPALDFHGVGDDRAKMIRAFVEFANRHIPNAATLAVGINQIRRTTDLPPKTPWQTRSYRWQEREELVRDVSRLGESAEAFLRITPLKRKPAQGRGKAEDSLGASVLWLDIDVYAEQRSQTRRILQGLPKPPTLVVDSGRGLHAYWSLDAFVTGLAAIKSRNKRLMQEINSVLGTKHADSVFDLARVMRIPGTYNLKGERTILARFLDYHPERVYSLDDFAEAQSEQEYDGRGSCPSIETWEPASLPENFLEEVAKQLPSLAQRIVTEPGAKEAGTPYQMQGGGRIDRSRNDFAIACQLFELGYEQGAVLAVLTHPTWFSGDKGRNRRDYAVTTVAQAQRQVRTGPGKYFSAKSFRPVLLAADLTKECAYVYTAEQLWYYKEGVYVPNGEDHLRKRVQQKLGDRWKASYASEVVTWIVDDAKVGVEETNNHDGLVNVKNGMLGLSSRTRLPHEPRYRSLVQLPMVYLADADPGAVDRFVASILPADAIDVFWEYVGSTLLTNHYWPKAFLMLIGPGDSGKSQLLEFVRRLLGGSAYVSSVSMQDLAYNAFMRSLLFGKLANIRSDLSDTEAQSTGWIKSLTGDDTITADRKHKKPFDFRSTARLFFSANHSPQVRGADEAYFRRAMVIPCLNSFTGEKADDHIVDKVTTPECLSGALLRMLDGMARLRKQSGFSHSKSIEQAGREYSRTIDTVTEFLEDETEADEKGQIPKGDMYVLYDSWCSLNGRKTLAKNNFSRRVREVAQRFGISEGHPVGLFGTQRECWIGRRLGHTSQG